MGLQKNTASQKWRVFAFDITTGAAKTGDAANISAKIGKDFAAAVATNDVAPTEVEDGYYDFDLTQAESNANVLDLLPESSTSNIQVIGVPGRIFTRIIQTGDSFGRLGAPAGATIAADLVVIDDFVDDIEGVTGNLPDGGQLNDLATILVDTANMQPKLGTPAADLAADIAAVKVDTAAVLVDTADMQPKLGTPAADLAADVAAVKVDTAATLVDTADIQPKIGTPAADLAADVAAVKVVVDSVETDTQDIQGRIPTALAVGGQIKAHTEVVSTDANDAAAQAADAVDEIVDQNWDELRSGHVVQGSFGESFDAIEFGKAVAGTLSTTNMTTDLTETTEDHYKGRTLVWRTGVLKRQATDITAYLQATKELVFTAVTEAPSADDEWVMV